MWGDGISGAGAGEPGSRWWAVWVEEGRRRYRKAVSEERLAVKLEKVLERLATGAADIGRPGAELSAAGQLPGGWLAACLHGRCLGVINGKYLGQACGFQDAAGLTGRRG